MEAATRRTSGDSPMVTVEEFDNWTISFSKSHILPSKCSQPCDLLAPCTFCRYDGDLKLEHLPEMVFPYNRLALEHKSGCVIEFNALDALRRVATTRDGSLSVQSARAWRQARIETGLVDNTIGNFDWTFRTDYKGTFTAWPPPEATSMCIDTERLKQEDKNLLYEEIVLYEDELHDNGISLLNVRIRVVNWGFYILMRHFLRIDGVALSVFDTRMCHDFSTNYILVEQSSRQGSIPELEFPLSLLKEPDQVAPLVPLLKKCTEKYIIRDI